MKQKNFVPSEQYNFFFPHFSYISTQPESELILKKFEKFISFANLTCTYNLNPSGDKIQISKINPYQDFVLFCISWEHEANKFFPPCVFVI